MRAAAASVQRAWRAGAVLAALGLGLGGGRADADKYPPLRAASDPGAAAAASTSSAASALGPANAEPLARANALIEAGELGPACDALAEAYARTHEPLLQLRIGRLRQKLGQAGEARAAYQRFIDEAQAPHPGLRDEALRALRTLPPAPVVSTPSPPTQPVIGRLPLVPVPAAAPPRSLYREVRRDRRQMLLGGVMLGIGYLAAAGVAAGLASSVGQPDAPSAAANYTLLVPVVGPFVSGIVAPVTNENGNGRPLISSWSLPWMVTSGLVQVAGLLMFSLGAAEREHALPEPPAPPPGAPPP